MPGCLEDKKPVLKRPVSAEPLGFCRKVLQNVSHNNKPVEEGFCRTLGVLQNFGSQAQFFRPANSSPIVAKLSGLSRCLRRF